MKNLITLIAALVLVTGLTSTVNAQNSVKATAIGSAEIITPLAISKAGDMNFGKLAVNATAGTIELTPAGVRNATGGVSLPGTTGTVSTASFTVTGLGTSGFAISLPSSYTLSDGVGHSMIVNTFKSTPSGSGALVGGTQTINVGATLNVGASQVAGSYTNATGFDVTVNYN